MPLRARLVATAALATAALASAGFLLAPSALAASHPVQGHGSKLQPALLPANLMLKLINRVKKLR